MLVESNNDNLQHLPLNTVTVEITVISAQGLKNSSTSLSSLFSKRIKPFVTLAAPTPISSPWNPPPEDTELHYPTHTTKIDSRGGGSPTWDETFQVPISGASFFSGFSTSALLLTVYTESFMRSRNLLGWCHIPMADIGWPPMGSVRFLSYRLRARDGTRGHGIVNLAVRLKDRLHPVPKQMGYPNVTDHQACPAIGIPVSMLRAPATTYYNMHTCQI